jgi:hypothetical protein
MASIKSTKGGKKCPKRVGQKVGIPKEFGSDELISSG